MPVVALSATGRRIGLGNGRAVAPDAVVVAVIEAREAGASWRALFLRFKVPIKTMRNWVAGRSRCTAPHQWKRVPEVMARARTTVGSCPMCGHKEQSDGQT